MVTQTLITSARERQVLLFAAFAVSLFIAFQTFTVREPIASAETRFVEMSNGGMQIVPASCPSSPSNPDYPHDTCSYTCNPQYICIGDDLYRRVNYPTCSNQFYLTCAYGCANGACLSGDGGGGSSGDLIVSPSLISSGETTNVSWTTTGLTSCTVTEDNPNISDSWVGDNGAVRPSSAIAERTTYTLTCSGTVVDTGVVNIVPIFQEL